LDRIIKHLIADLLDCLELNSEGESTDFEKFANFGIISKEYSKTYDLDLITVGSGDDTGIDGLAIIVNGQLIESVDEIDFFIENNNYLEATYVFVQSKSSASFNSGEMNTFFFGVKDFFSEKPKLRRNKDIQDFADISDYLLSKASHFRENPTCKLYYVTTGTLNDDQNMKAVIETAENELVSTNLFSKVSFTPLGANEIAKMYRETKSSITASFLFTDKVTLPDLPGIQEAYYGILPFREFKKLLVDENENLRNVFYDNVRDFQGFRNPVNKTIANTLENVNPELFTVLNNGVTIVASALKPSGNRFTITDYQIVNGCQTSNVLFSYADLQELDDLKIPLKLIITDNDEVKNSITIATNSQTAIKREQLKAMTDFQKNLEHYYNTIEGDGRLYYERRAGQYQSDSSVIRTRIMTIQTQIKAFSAIFIENPHRVTSYFGTIVKQNIEVDNPTIFNPKHKFIPYYVSGLTFYRLDSLFRARVIPPKYKKVKFYLLMLFRMMVQPEPLPLEHFNSPRKTDQYCNPIVNILNDKNRTTEYFQATIQIVDQSGIDSEDKQSLKQANTVRKVIKAFKNFQKQTVLGA